MDDLVRRSIQLVESKHRSSVPWTVDEPWSQSYHIYSTLNQKWQAFEPGNNTTSEDSQIHKLALYSWNIDFMLPFEDSRMQAAVRHLEKLVKDLDKDTGTIIYLQECVDSDLKLLASDTWVRKNFILTDLDMSNWQSGHYGTVTLVDKRLPITSCFRVHYSQTRMERDAFFVDIQLQHKTARFCNTHLESLALEPPYRPPQMQMVAKYMHDDAVHGAVVAGDFNAIQDFDRKLHSDNKLKDAYLELGGDEGDAASGHTWGQQAATIQRERFGTSRMDKVFFCGGLHCSRFERFGSGVELEDDVERNRIVDLGFEKPWVTDHLGVMAVFEVVSHQPSQAKI
jgi:tyrosyl-DNA phosphodiesterase 2